MKITILAYGSQGDVQPFLPLALRLMEHGHSVKLAAPGRFQGLVAEHGIEFVPLAGDPRELSRRFNNAGHNSIKLLREFTNHAVQIGADVWRQTGEACQNADLIIHTFAHAVGAHTLAREQHIPDIHVQTFPMFSPTADYPHVSLPDLRSGRLNRLTHELSAKIAWWTSRYGFERVRRRAGLARRKLYWPFAGDSLRPETPILCAWSQSVLPASSDWPPYVSVTGYYFQPLPDSYRPPRELTAFLLAGKAPVCVTFGSMVHRAAERIDRIVAEALKRTGHRGVILSGWSGLKKPATNDLLYLEAAQHAWLLPLCSMVIHHGGAGTTAAGLRGGIPNIVLPFIADQPFWGKRVHAIGAGPKPVLVKDLSEEKLTRLIEESQDQALRERAHRLGDALQREDGVGEAVKQIEQHANDFYGNS